MATGKKARSKRSIKRADESPKTALPTLPGLPVVCDLELPAEIHKRPALDSAAGQHAAAYCSARHEIDFESDYDWVNPDLGLVIEQNSGEIDARIPGKQPLSTQSDADILDKP